MYLGNASIQFVAFGLAVAALVNLGRSTAWRFAVLFAASILFVALLGGDLKSFLPLTGFLALGYLGLWMIRKGVSKALFGSLVVVIFAYVWLKKYTILPETAFLPFAYLTVGLSYIFFRVLHLLIESGQDEARLPGIGAYLLYTLNFTTLVSGPIQRFDEFEHQTLPLDAGVIATQIERIIIGFFKVNIVATLLQAVQQDALADLSHPLWKTPLLFAAARLAVVYPFFLYANFSGYIDIVIALARLMRLKLPENFHRPFSASSFLDFWNRWHITLSVWLKTYVYNPLLMALMRRIADPRVHAYLAVLCFFVTFFLVGIWHGRTTEFAMFGVLQGGGVAINKLWQVQLAQRLGNKRYRALAKAPVYIAFGRGLTFSWFALSLFWFWASWREIHLAAGALSTGAWLIVWLIVWLTATVTLAAWEALRSTVLAIKIGSSPLIAHRYLRVVVGSALAVISLTLAVVLNQTAPDIVYKAF